MTRLHTQPATASLARVDPEIAIVGCGGGGTWAALALASAGVRRFRLLDFDRVEISNLNRQTAYCPADVGRRKTEVLAERLRDWTEAKVDTTEREVAAPEDLLSFLSGASLAVSTIDQPWLEVRRIVPQACRLAGIPGFFVGHGHHVTSFGPLILPNAPGCPYCFIQTRQSYMAWLDRPHDYSSHGGTALSSSFAVVSSFMLDEVEDYFAGRKPTLVGAELGLSFLTWEQELRRLQPEEYCDDCRALELRPSDRREPAGHPATRMVGSTSG